MTHSFLRPTGIQSKENKQVFRKKQDKKGINIIKTLGVMNTLDYFFNYKIICNFLRTRIKNMTNSILSIKWLNRAFTHRIL